MLINFERKYLRPLNFAKVCHIGQNVSRYAYLSINVNTLFKQMFKISKVGKIEKRMTPSGKKKDREIVYMNEENRFGGTKSLYP